MTYQEALKKAEARFEAAGIADARSDAWQLFAWVCGITRTYYFMHMTDALKAETEIAFEKVVQKRCTRIPLQQITGSQDFMGLSFLVTSDVLCPRQDTETLVEEALKEVRPGMKVLDMCTGSGCIIISLAKLAGHLEGTGADLSEAALEVARRNNDRLQAGVTFVQSNLFSNISEKYDMILSNPPYIRSGEIPGLMPEVALHEPLMALDGKEDGLYFYREIIRASRNHLKDQGKILFEIGYDQGKDVSGMLIAEGFKNVRVIRDLSTNERVVTGEL